MIENGNEIWAKVFARLLLARISDPTWQATFTVPEDMQSNRCFNQELVTRCTTGDAVAYDLFITDFIRLRPDWQIRLTGKTYNEWNNYDREVRGVI